MARGQLAKGEAKQIDIPLNGADEGHRAEVFTEAAILGWSGINMFLNFQVVTWANRK